MSLSWGVRSGRQLAALVALSPGALSASEIRWSGAPECRRELEVTEQVEAMTERRLSEVAIADFELVLESREDATVGLTLVTTPRVAGAPSRRSLEGASCVEVTDAAAVAIALTIGERSQAAPALVKPAAAPASTPVPPRKKPEVRAAPVAARPSWRVGVNGVLDTAVTPRAVLGGAPRFVFAYGRVRAELEGAIFAAGRVVDAQERGGSFQLSYVAPLACLTSPLGGASVLLCTGYELGRLGAVGEGISTPYERDVFWHALRGEAGVVLPLAPGLWLAGRLGTAIALTRPGFVLDAPLPVHRPAPLSFRASLGLELAL